jgi:hypothetical protein
MRAQSLNTCKRVGVESHIPYLLRSMGMEVQSTLGRVISQLLGEKEICMAKEGSFYRHVFGMNNKKRTGKKSTRAGATKEGLNSREFWRR